MAAWGNWLADTGTRTRHRSASSLDTVRPRPAPAWPLKTVRIAVIGRTQSNVRLLSQAQQPASATALLSAKKSLTSRSRPCDWSPWWSRRATNCANRSQWPGGSSEWGPSAQYSAITFCSSVRPRAQGEQVARLRHEFDRPVPGRTARRSQGARRDGECRYTLPLGADKPWRDHATAAIHVSQGLPGVGIMDARRIKWRADIHRIVDRHVPGVVGVGDAWCPARLVAELIGAIPMAVVEHGLGRDVADASWSCRVGRAVGDVVAEARHEGIEHGRRARREQVDRRAIGGETDSLRSGWPGCEPTMAAVRFRRGACRPPGDRRPPTRRRRRCGRSRAHGRPSADQASSPEPPVGTPHSTGSRRCREA